MGINEILEVLREKAKSSEFYMAAARDLEEAMSDDSRASQEKIKVLEDRRLESEEEIEDFYRLPLCMRVSPMRIMVIEKKAKSPHLNRVIDYFAPITWEMEEFFNMDELKVAKTWDGVKFIKVGTSLGARLLPHDHLEGLVKSFSIIARSLKNPKGFDMFMNARYGKGDYFRPCFSSDEDAFYGWRDLFFEHGLAERFQFGN